MNERFEKIKTSIENLIEKLDRAGIIGPISYLEEAIEDIDRALEEYELYSSENE